MPTGTNLVLNGGFETGDFTDWTVTDPEPGNPDIGVDTLPEDVESGSYGVFAGNSDTSTLSQTIATIPGHTYNISFYLDVYQADATNGFMSATFGGQSVVDLVEPSETDQFTQYTASIVATSADTLLQFQFQDPGGFFGFDNVSVIDNATCYCRGTNILTALGEVPVEHLNIGDWVMTERGAPRQIRWIGRRSYAGRFLAGKRGVLPIRLRAGSLGANLPERDLRVSPCHAMFLAGILVPASALVNGVSIVQEHDVTEVEYFHVELATHDVLIAEGAPSESFVDDGGRTRFHNAGEYATLYPNATPEPAIYCAPRIETGSAVDAIWERLAQLCGAMPVQRVA